MSTEIKIRTAVTPEEIADAQRIRRRVFNDEQGIPPDLEFDALDESASHVLCYLGNMLVGTGRLVPLNANSAALSRIAILPEYRGHGYGSMIVMALEAAATQHGVRELTLQPHKHLESFYERLGFKRVPGTSSVAGHELITMRKPIEQVSGADSRTSGDTP